MFEPENSQCFARKESSSPYLGATAHPSPLSSHAYARVERTVHVLLCLFDVNVILSSFIFSFNMSNVQYPSPNVIFFVPYVTCSFSP